MSRSQLKWYPRPCTTCVFLNRDHRRPCLVSPSRLALDPGPPSVHNWPPMGAGVGARPCAETAVRGPDRAVYFRPEPVEGKTHRSFLSALPMSHPLHSYPVSEIILDLKTYRLSPRRRNRDFPTIPLCSSDGPNILRSSLVRRSATRRPVGGEKTASGSIFFGANHPLGRLSGQEFRSFGRGIGRIATGGMRTGVALPEFSVADMRCWIEGKKAPKTKGRSIREW